jgi:hypothetical protein
MKLSPETLRMAETNFQHAREDILLEYRRTCHQIAVEFKTAARIDNQIAKSIPPLLRRMGEALVNIYLKAFYLENKVPEHSDEAELDRKIELLCSREHGFIVQGLPMGGDIPEVEQRLLQYMHAKAHEMRLRGNLPKDGNITYSFQGDVTGGVAIGPGTNQNIEINDEAKPRSKR